MLRPEQILQINYVNWFKEKFPLHEQDIHHIANERKCSFQEGRILKRMAVTPGLFDIFIAYPNSDYHGFWLEFKINKNKLNESQQKFMIRKMELGFYCAVAWDLETAKDLTKNYLSIQ